MKKVTIIVPVYNVEKFIGKCIKSVLNQTYKNFELIIVNDGSPDNSLEICNYYNSLDDRIKIFTKENGGLSSARNYGIEKASGDYICFIDSDDYIEKDFIKNLLETALKSDSDIVICNYNRVFENKSNNAEIVTDYKISEIDRNKLIRDLLIIKEDNYACNKLYKSSLFKTNRFPEGHNFEDLGTTYKIYLEAKKITKINYNVIITYVGAAVLQIV